MSLRVIWQYMDRSVTKQILYGPRFGPYNIFLVTDRSIYCHITLSAMNYLLYNAIFNTIIVIQLLVITGKRDTCTVKPVLRGHICDKEKVIL